MLLARALVVALARLRREEEAAAARAAATARCAARSRRSDAAVSMWLTPCASSSSSVRSASACETLPSAAAPKIVRLLSWPVRPNGAVAITQPTLAK